MRTEALVHCSLAGCTNTSTITNGLGAFGPPDDGIVTTSYLAADKPRGLRAVINIQDRSDWFCSWEHLAEYAAKKTQKSAT